MGVVTLVLSWCRLGAVLVAANAALASAPYTSVERKCAWVFYYIAPHEEGYIVEEHPVLEGLTYPTLKEAKIAVGLIEEVSPCARRGEGLQWSVSGDKHMAIGNVLKLYLVEK